MNAASPSIKNREAVRGYSAFSLLRNLLSLLGLLVVVILTTPVDRWWVHAYAGSVDQPSGDVLIVLSAAGDDAGVLAYSSYWRARYALRAWNTGQFKVVLISGGAGNGIRSFLVAGGVPAEAIRLETQSTSTEENARNTGRVLEGIAGSRVLLTSDFHMYRALRVFQKQGIAVTPYPAPDVIKLSQHWYGRISGFQTMCVESVKILGYRVHGWI